MNLYAYRAILSKSLLMQGQIKFTDKRVAGCAVFLPLDSQCIVGQVLAENADQAKKHALVELQRKYPEERGYKDHDNIVITPVQQETIIC